MLFYSPQRVIHSILAGRAILHLREQNFKSTYGYSFSDRFWRAGEVTSAVQFASVKSPLSLDNDHTTHDNGETDTNLDSERSRGKRKMHGESSTVTTTFFSMQDLKSSFGPSISTATTTTAVASGSGNSANASRSVVDPERLDR